MQEILEIALEAAAAAMREAERYQAALDTVTFKEKQTGKTAGSDIASEADSAAEEAIREVIARHRPQDAVIGEENGETAGTGYVWIVDPIDGTLNFSYGRNEWAVSIAVEIDGETKVAVVAAQNPERYYTAVLGEGAFLNGKAIHARNTKSLSKAMIDVGRGRGDTRTLFTSVVSELDKTCRDIRRGGCAALAACQVASGEIDAMYGPGLETWDIAAGMLIASEAGAEVVYHRSDVVLIAPKSIITELQQAVERVVPA